MKLRVLVVAGGSAGHLFPGICLSEEIISRNIGEVLFVTTSRGEGKELLKKKQIPFILLSIIPFRPKDIFTFLDFVWRFLSSAIKTVILLFRFRPNVVVGFGGYVSGPVLMISSLVGIKTIIHEQNVYPGKANRLLARFVDRIAIGFSETIRYLGRYRTKTVFSGNPLRKELKNVSSYRGNTFVVLVIGGSQGARVLNRIVPEAIALLDVELRKSLEVIHIAGYEMKDEVSKAYINLGIKNRVYSFTNEIAYLYNECDFVISRAGAITVSELLYIGKPSILVPYPYAGGHQYLNAEVLTRKGLGLLLDERYLTPKMLSDAIVSFMDRKRLDEMSKGVKERPDRDPCDILIEEVLRG